MDLRGDLPLTTRISGNDPTVEIGTRVAHRIMRQFGAKPPALTTSAPLAPSSAAYSRRAPISRRTQPLKPRPSAEALYSITTGCP